MAGQRRHNLPAHPVRHFSEHRQHVLDELISLRRKFEPDLVLTMNSADTHQDHAVVPLATLGRRARGGDRECVLLQSDARVEGLEHPPRTGVGPGRQETGRS